MTVMNDSSEMEWAEGQVFKLIELYRDQPTLWNQVLPDYKNKIIKNFAWNEISEQMELSKLEVQAKMKKLIFQFNREYKKAKLGSGALEGKVKWRFFNALQFMKYKNIPRQTRKTEGEKEAFQVNSEPVGIDTENAAASASAWNTISTITSPINFPAPRKKKRKLNPDVQEAYNVMRLVQSKLKKKDEFDVFGEHVAFQIRKLTDERSQALVKHRISQVLFDMEMSQIDSQHTITPTNTVQNMPNATNINSTTFSDISVPFSPDDSTE